MIFVSLWIDEKSCAFYFELDLNLRSGKRVVIISVTLRIFIGASALFFSPSSFCDCEE